MTDGRRGEEGGRGKARGRKGENSGFLDAEERTVTGELGARNGEPISKKWEAFLRGGPAWGHKRPLPAKAEVVYISQRTIAAFGTHIEESFENIKPWGALSAFQVHLVS